MDRDDVGLREQRVQVSKLGQVRGDPPPSRIEDSELEPAGTPRDGAADAPEPDDAERRPCHLLGEPALRPGTGPAARADRQVALDHLPAGREHRREGQIGRGLVENPRRVQPDDDVALGTGDVDAVVAGSEVGDDL